jgi:AraC family transcriptional regulator
MAEIQVKEIGPVEVISLPFTGPYEQTQEKLEQLMSWLLRVGHPYSSAPFALYYADPAKVPPDQLRAEVCLAVDEACEPVEDIQRRELPGVTVAWAIHKGPYAEIQHAYEEIFGWIPENGYRYVEGEPTREVFHTMYGQVDDPQEFVTELQVPVEQP